MRKKKTKYDIIDDTRPFFNDENNIVGLGAKLEAASPLLGMTLDKNIILWLL